MAWEKIETILKEVGSSPNEIAKMVTYLRRAEDCDAHYEQTCQFLNTHCPDLLDNPSAMTLSGNRFLSERDACRDLCDSITFKIGCFSYTF